MKRVFQVVIAVAAFFAAYYFVQSYFFKPSDESINAEIEKAVNEINERCPMMVDQHTRLDNAETMDKDIIYNYTIIGISDDAFLGSKDAFIDEVSMKAKTNSETKKVLAAGVTMRYVYKNENGIELLRFDVQK